MRVGKIRTFMFLLPALWDCDAWRKCAMKIYMHHGVVCITRNGPVSPCIGENIYTV